VKKITYGWAPLSGVRALEYGGGVAAAYCAKLLGDLGAEVVKVRPGVVPELTPDADLRVRAEGLYLDVDKKLIDVEVGSADFISRFSASDIVVRGYEPSGGAAAGLRDEYERWRGVSAGLVFLALTPFGVSGPGSSWRGGDLNAQALSGWTYITGKPDEAPLSMNYGMGALQHGLSAAGAAVAAALQRGTRQGGDFLDISEADVIASTMRMYSLTYRFLQIEPRRNGLRAPGSSGRYPHTLLPCKDGYISTICRSETDWSRFVEMMGDPAWAQEPRYRNFFAMGTEYPDEVDALIIPWLMEHTRDEMGELATKYRVPLAPVRTVDEVLRDAQLEHRDFFVTRRFEGHDVGLPGIAAIPTLAGDPQLDPLPLPEVGVKRAQ
jgi:crotonobetainyl-CoA:carnitine CoA-transferase CaiB-like acyl-CoA transferase